MEIGELGIVHLKQIWEKHVNGVVGEKNEGHLNHLILDGLEIGTIEAVQFLKGGKPSFSDFEKWILDKKNGFISDELREKINRGVESFLKEPRPIYPLKLDIKEPVFTKEDMEFWEENGYIVLKNAVCPEDCKVLENAIWEYLKMSPDNPNEWNKRNKAFWIDNLRHPIEDKNRKSERIHKAFAQIWGNEELFTAVKRLSFNPPLDKECTQYGPSTLHWDASIAQPMPLDVIGMLYLNDVAENQGAFQCVAGFHKKIKSWIENLPKEANPRDKILNAFEAVKVSANAGDLIICRQELPHGSSVNRGNYPRFVQYISMYPADRGINPIWK